MNPTVLKNDATQDAPGAARATGLAPIALFVYSRPEHTRRTVQRLRQNVLASQSELHIFADAAKNANEAGAVEEVRELIHAIEGFRSVTIVERSANLGLAASVIDGITRLCDAYGRVIAVEDDLLTAPDFLAFMNSALDHYQFVPGVFSVGAFNYGIRPPQGYSADAFFSYRSCSWGWATWRDRWRKADWQVSDYLDFRSDTRRIRRFSRGGGDLGRMLARQMAGKLDSWAIRWAYAHCTHDAVALLPVQSRVLNIGLDGSGTHCRRVALPQGVLATQTDTAYRFPNSILPDRCFTDQIRRNHPGSFLGRAGKYLARQVRAKLRRRSGDLQIN